VTDFTTEAGIRIPDRELRDAKRQVEESIGSVTVSVDAQSGAGGPGVGGRSPAALAGGAGALDALDDQTEVLREIHQELEKIGTTGGGGGGDGGVLGGASGFTLGNLAGSVTGGAVSGGLAAKAGRAAGFLRGGAGLARLAGGRSPWTLLQQTKDMRDVSPSEGGPGGPVTNVMGDLATGQFQLKEDFWPDLEPPEDFWPDIQPPENLFPDLEPPENLWPGRDETSSEDRSKDGPVMDTDVPSGSQETIDGTRGVRRGGSVPDLQTPSGSRDTIEGTRGVRRGGAVTDPSPSGSSTRENGRTDVTINEVSARIDGRGVEDVLSRLVENLRPELKKEIENELASNFRPQ